ncbi:MAG TPA: GGDEF domain-containing protein, partial [Ilumatobacteraceae bacterium]|nr:GGDEF domain-containing protein [Ilumatobacteraceae bacterium]
MGRPPPANASAELQGSPKNAQVGPPFADVVAMVDGGTHDGEIRSGDQPRRTLGQKGTSWPTLWLAVVGVVGLVSVARVVSDHAGGATARWVVFAGLTAMSVFGLVAVPLRSLLMREQRGLMDATQLARQQAVTDPLTGLLNRRSLDEIVHSLIRGQVRFSVSICDLDQFKQLNDNHGHDVGDRALRLFANMLRSVVRNGDFVARMGGEEFVLILLDSTKHNGFDVLQRARRQLGVQLATDLLPAFTFSGGVADSTEETDWGALLRLADQRLLAA